MNDEFLHGYRRDPDAELAERVRARLAADAAGIDEAPRGFAWPRLVAAAAAVAVVVAVVFSPTLRAYATAFLDQFRVRRFAAVEVDPARLEAVKQGTGDLKKLIAQRVETLEEPGPPRVFLDLPAAAAAAGIPVRVPRSLPEGLAYDTVFVQGQGAARFTVAAREVDGVLEALGIRDLSVPPGLDGAEVTVLTRPAVIIPFAREKRRAVLIQAKSPEVSLPQGLDLQRLGEIGLRILGLDPDEARRFARTIDWHGTMLVPVPANANAFREVTVRGNNALLVTTDGAPAGSNMSGRRGAMVLWSEGDRVYALTGNIGPEDLLVMASSLE